MINKQNPGLIRDIMSQDASYFVELLLKKAISRKSYA